MSDTEPISPRAFAVQHVISLEVTDGPTRGTDSEGWEHTAYTLRLSYAQDFGENTCRHTIDVPWRQGLAFTDGPDLSDVIGNLAGTLRDRDATWEDFAGDYGFNEDSRRDYAIWERSVALGRQLAEWAGHRPNMLRDFELVEDL